MSGEHSEVGGSAAHRFFPCPGSVRLCRGMPNIDTEFSIRGHEAHQAAAFALSFGCEPVHEDAWAIKKYIAEVTILREALADGAVEYIEHWFHRPEIDERFKGTIDYAIVCGKRGALLDYKNGEGVWVDVRSNLQDLYYAVEMVMLHPEVEMWDLGICQPRAGNGETRWWEVSREYILEWLEQRLKPALAATLDPNAPLVPDAEKQCKFCRARTVCSALKSQEVAVMEPASVSPLTDAELNHLAKMWPTVAARGRAIMGELSRRAADHPENFPDFKWVRASKTHRVWGPDTPSWQDMPEEYCTEPELKSPAQMEKMGRAGKQFVARHAIKPKGKLELVPITHEGASVALPSLQEKYADVLEDLAGE